MKRQTNSAKAGLQFPVGRVRGILKAGKYSKRLTASAPVYLAGELVCLASERCDDSSDMT